MKPLLFFFLFPIAVVAQQNNNKTPLNQVTSYDLATLFTYTGHPSVMGFIGTDYQRFRIKFISVIKNNDAPAQYFVYGKSKVKENICEFQGTLTVREVTFFPPEPDPEPEYKDVKQGMIKGDYVFNENPQQKHVGQFKGKFTTNFYINKEGKLFYDDIMGGADGFSNNMFTGTWKGYSAKTSKPCNWGDHRIPDSGDLDHGAGEFYPNDKYLANGWQSYKQAYFSEGGPESEAARKKESEEWWK